MVAWDHVTRADVLRAIEEYDRLGPERIVPETQRYVAERMEAKIRSHAVDHTPSVTTATAP